VRNGESCESCKPAHFAAGLRSGCYRGSRMQSLLVGRATIRQWQKFVSRGMRLYWLALWMSELSSQCVATFRDLPGLAQRARGLTTAANWQNLSKHGVRLWRSTCSHPVNREWLLSIYAAALALKRTSARL
jgi:hypothetical protein